MFHIFLEFSRIRIWDQHLGSGSGISFMNLFTLCPTTTSSLLSYMLGSLKSTVSSLLAVAVSLSPGLRNCEEHLGEEEVAPDGPAQKEFQKLDEVVSDLDEELVGEPHDDVVAQLDIDDG